MLLAERPHLPEHLATMPGQHLKIMQSGPPNEDVHAPSLNEPCALEVGSRVDKVLRMNDGDLLEPREVGLVEGENPGNAVDEHRGDKPRIVDLDARHTMFNHEPPPNTVDLVVFFEFGEAALYVECLDVCFFRRQAKAVSVLGPR